MIESEAGTLQGMDVLRATLDEIERLRNICQQKVRNRPHPLLKRFTQQELTDEACPTYKNLLVGRSQRVPDRQTLMQIANYLECTMTQRNDLLLAARYLPESLELEGIQLQRALEQARHIMGTLSYPAMIVTHTLEIETVNKAFQDLFEFSPLTTIPKAQRYVLPLLFRHDLPIRERSCFNDQAVKAWQAGVSRGIQLFKQSNRLYQFEAWYQELVEQFFAVADFRQYWEQAHELHDQQQERIKLLLSRNAITGELLPIQIQQVRISVCSRMYPCIMAFLPVDDQARAVFTSLNQVG